MPTSALSGGDIARGLGGKSGVKWPLERSSDLFELRYGKALVASSRRPGRVPVFGTNGQTGTHDTPLFAGPGVVIGRKGAGHLGVHWTDQDYWVIDTAYSLIPRGDVDLKFAYYLVNYVGLNHLKHGTSNPSLTREAFGAQYFPVPPIEEQRAMAASLGALDEKIESNGRAEALSLELLDAISAEEAATHPRVSLGTIARLVRTVAKPADYGDQLVHHYSIPAFDAGARPEHVAASTIMSNKVALQGPAILVSRLNPRFNRTWWVSPDTETAAFASPEFAMLTAADRRSLAGVWLAVRDDVFRNELTRRVTGTSGSHQRIRPHDMLAIEVPDIARISSDALDRALALLDRIESLRTEVKHLCSVRDALLPELLSGRVLVPKAAA